MTTQALDESARRRTLRRRHLLQRQTIIFGSIMLVLAATGLAALGVFLGILPPPFDADFTDTSTPEVAEDITPCPPDGALPVAWPQITTNVYNGSSTTGLAGSIATSLQASGVLMVNVANYPNGSYDGATLLVTGVNGVASAYTLAAVFPGAVIQFDPLRTDTTVDVVAGAAYQPLLDPASNTPDPATPLTPREGCTPFTQLPVPSAAATA